MSLRLGIMQPYFLPYIGYFQLMHAVDVFVLYDNIKYTKKGWINRNRFLRDGKDAVFSIPLKSAPDDREIRDRNVSESFDRKKLLNQLQGAYRRAPFLQPTLHLVEEIVNDPCTNLYDYLFNSIRKTCRHLDICTEFRISSQIGIDHSLKGQDRVLAMCESVGATTYINLPGGMGLYSKEAFQDRGMELKFIRPLLFPYPQFGPEFVPWLSIVDVLMFNSVDDIRSRILPGYDLMAP